jgi:hypothetical protein
MIAAKIKTAAAAAAAALLYKATLFKIALPITPILMFHIIFCTIYYYSLSSPLTLLSFTLMFNLNT